MFGSVGKLRRQISGLLGKSTARANHGVRVLEIPPLVRPRGMVESGPGKIQARWLAARILERVPEISSSRVVVSSPLWAPVLRHLKLGRLCYDCIDHVEVFSGARHERLFQAWNSELMALCDVVSYVNPMLIEKPEREIAGKRAGLIPNAVRRDWISEPVRPRESPFPHDTRPVAGFLGSIFEWVDLSLLEAVARMAKEILFVLVGPSLRKSSTARLECLPNVLRFGPQPFTEVPRWLSAFDVGLIPFARGIIGERHDPIKLYEYSACGLPVVSTLEPPQPGPVADVRVARTCGSFCESVRRAAADNCQKSRDVRIQFARQNTWDHRADALMALME